MFQPGETQEYFIGGDLDRLLARIAACEKRYRHLTRPAGSGRSRMAPVTDGSGMPASDRPHGPADIEQFLLTDAPFKLQIPLNSIVAIAESFPDTVEEASGKTDEKTWNHMALVITNMISLRNDYTNYYGTLKAYNQALEQKVLEKTSRLKKQNKELQQALDSLRRSQSLLIQSEKMVALGQLIAGIAHEINTPLGVIRGTCDNLARHLESLLSDLPRLYQSLAGDRLTQFSGLIADIPPQEDSLSTREARKERRTIEETLKAAGLEEVHRAAEILVDIGLHGKVSQYLSLLRDPAAGDMLKSGENLASLRRAIRIIQTAVNQADRIVFALKKYVHRDHEDKQAPVDVVDSMETVLTLYYNWIKHGVEITKHYGSVPVIQGYQDELNQVWTNLIQNALQAMKHRGHLEIDIRTEGECVAVSIADNGPGVPETIRKDIFKPFFTTKPAGEGSGLGLDICRKIVEKHKGRIKFGSRPGRTVFRVLLPVIPVEAGQ